MEFFESMNRQIEERTWYCGGEDRVLELPLLAALSCGCIGLGLGRTDIGWCFCFESSKPGSFFSAVTGFDAARLGLDRLDGLMIRDCCFCRDDECDGGWKCWLGESAEPSTVDDDDDAAVRRRVADGVAASLSPSSSGWIAFDLVRSGISTVLLLAVHQSSFRERGTVNVR